MDWTNTPVVMGILNITEDSFYDGGCYQTEAAVIKRTEQMLSEGAAIIDLGAVSTRPGAADIPADEEWARLHRTIPLILREFPGTILSIDTWRASVAARAMDAGAAIINDISGGTFDPDMPRTVAQGGATYVLMHTTDKPNRMQDNTLNTNVLEEVKLFFQTQIAAFERHGVRNIILDPGFGFGKTLAQNYYLLQNLHAFHQFQKPLLVGISRKSMIYKLLGTTPANALNGTTVVHTIALLQNAAILRVHDVAPAMEAIKICQQLQNKIGI